MKWLLSKQQVLILIFSMLFSLSASAEIAVGAGLSSTASGRYVPGLVATYLDTSWAMSGTTVGMQTSAYSMSTYSLSYYRTWDVGPFFWGKITAGFGGGVGYSERDFRPTPTTPVITAGEFIIGPAFRASWEILNPVILTFDGLYGIALNNLGIPPLFHDVLMFSLGFKL